MTPRKIPDSNVLNWASSLEPQAAEQAARSARLPFVHGHLALMPDAHYGRGATVGSVIPTLGAIIPSAIGVDIGCGMIAAEMPFGSNLLPDDLGDLLSRIEAVVPAGVGQGHKDQHPLIHPIARRNDGTLPEMTYQQAEKATIQMGTLGAGNHFVEVCLDERDIVWVVLHSGSRGIGNQLASDHIEKAKGLMKQYFIDLEDPDLAYLVEGTPEFGEYIKAMLWAQDYALANREVMMDAVLAELWAAVRVGDPGEETQRINCHHNFTQREHHGGKNVWLTRKGAIQARKGDLGVIPGSMGTRSYIVRGLGNKASYDSCSHGAGRPMSRGAARKSISMEDFRASMEGIMWQEGSAKQLLDESPLAYKDIDQVMADQADLVEPLHTLHQVLNYKGTK